MSDSNHSVSIAVLGSVNLDIVASVPRLPVPGETVTGADIRRYPGGKGANQALAACRLGARTALIGSVGEDAEAGEALALLRAAGVDLSACRAAHGFPTGIALIAVSAAGENQIVVAPGANRALAPDALTLPPADALLAQLEIPIRTLETAAANFPGLICLNLAPAMRVSRPLLHRAHLIVVNETEAAFFGDALHDGPGLVAVTFGAAGARLYRGGEELAAAAAPRVQAIDTTGAGDCFTAALAVAMVEHQALEDALAFACAAAALATTVRGAQPSLPDRGRVEAFLRKRG
ncbi:MAG: ribokinase [Woeseia sp.]